MQGAKWATFGNRRYEYRAGQAMVVTIGMPSRGAVSEASPDKPFLGFVLEVNLAVLHKLAEQMQLGKHLQSAGPANASMGICVVNPGAEALDCLRRAVGLLEMP